MFEALSRRGGVGSDLVVDEAEFGQRSRQGALAGCRWGNNRDDALSVFVNTDMVSQLGNITTICSTDHDDALLPLAAT